MFLKVYFYVLKIFCDAMSINEKSPIAYFLEFDLEYSDKLHELHNDCPLALEKLAISSDMLSNY